MEDIGYRFQPVWLVRLSFECCCPDLLQVAPFSFSCHRCCFSSRFEGELPIGLAKGAGFAGFSSSLWAMPVRGAQSTAPLSSSGSHS